MWCEHINLGWVGNVDSEMKEVFVMNGVNIHFDKSLSPWIFCPICGTPRPKEKSLVEKVIEAMDKAGGVVGGPLSTYEKTMEAMAQAAIDTIKREEGK